MMSRSCPHRPHSLDHITRTAFLAIGMLCLTSWLKVEAKEQGQTRSSEGIVGSPMSQAKCRVSLITH